MEYEKIAEKIGDIRANILQEYEKIKKIKQDALLVLNEELASYQHTIEDLKEMRKNIQKA